MPKPFACLCVAMLLLTPVGKVDAARHHSPGPSSTVEPSIGACTITGVVHNRRDQLVRGASIKIFRRRGGGPGHLDAQQEAAPQ